MFDRFIHKTLGRPYRLTVTQDIGRGTPVVFLHGIASSSLTWRNVTPKIDTHQYRLITIDLLGFGTSPKPDWSNYSADEHAAAVITTIKKLHVGPVILVGHSMGSLIAARIASLHTELVKHLILCSMPLYQNGDIDDSINAYKKTGRQISNAYFKVYQALAKRPDFTLKGAKEVMKMGGDDTSFRLDETTWQPFKQSLKNTIEQQTAFSDVKNLTVPTDIIYGSYDLFVLGNYFKEFATVNKNITVTQVSGRHEITPKYATAIVKLITKA
ncbi:MAG: alpha/beta hydrolase [Candidatus Saccharimonadales bacterium]